MFSLADQKALIVGIADEHSMAHNGVQARLLTKALTRHTARGREDASDDRERAQESLAAIRDAWMQIARPSEFEAAGTVGAAMGQPFHHPLVAAWQSYVMDTVQRSLLMLDALRKRGDIFLEHEAAGAPPVLIYDYEVVLDGADLPRPCNYMLLRIKAPEGMETFAWKRPYVIIDPRAGHGPGIGGFKPDSQVGVALADGHPVYFIAFRPQPEPGQTIADVTHAEAAFLRHVGMLHAEAPKPIMVGNCQGGWATAILAACNPDLTGPIVLNGAPMAYWSGRVGQDPMRYAGGAVGGVVPALVSADLGGGLFDGANLVLNFEMLNPGRTWFRKYYDLYRDIDRGEERFLDFERWWGGFFLMTGSEIGWIVENLFIGNRLSRNTAQLEPGRPIDLKAIRAPVIVFASHGDNITPPQQALNWIVDSYVDEREIELRGQRILYMVHEQVGHLGIFVSSSIAKREHSQMASTLKTIEALPPGLYEMTIEDVAGEGHRKTFTVSFFKRTFEDLCQIDDKREEEHAFAAVSHLSEQLAETYGATARPWLQAMGRFGGSQIGRSMHPMRARRSAFASTNPAMAAVAGLADQARAKRASAAASNPFVLAERFWADQVEQAWDVWRDWRALATEMGFFALYANPLALWYGEPKGLARAHRSIDELRALPEVQLALEGLKTGGYAEAVVRMLVLLADTRGDVRRDRLERSSQVLSTHEPFKAMEPAARTRMIHHQTLIAHFEKDRGLAALAHLLPNKADRQKALATVDYIVGSVADMEPTTIIRMNEMRRALGIDPLADAPARRQPAAEAAEPRFSP